MVGIMQNFAVRCSVSILQMNEQLSVIATRLRQKSEQYAGNLQQRDSGAVTAEYAVVLIAATGFAAVLIAILKSGAIRTALTQLVQKALKIS